MGLKHVLFVAQMPSINANDTRTKGGYVVSESCIVFCLLALGHSLSYKNICGNYGKCKTCAVVVLDRLVLSSQDQSELWRVFRDL